MQQGQCWPASSVAESVPWPTATVMNRERTIRTLRIATSAVIGVLCVLQVALWIRSYCWDESLNWRISPNENVHLGSDVGVFYLGKATLSPWRAPHPTYSRDEAGQYANKYELIRRPTYLVDSTSWQLRNPLLAIVLLTATSATFPWFKWRFSLRTLLIAIALVSIVMAAVVVAVR